MGECCEDEIRGVLALVYAGLVRSGREVPGTVLVGGWELAALGVYRRGNIDNSHNTAPDFGQPRVHSHSRGHSW